MELLMDGVREARLMVCSDGLYNEGNNMMPIKDNQALVEVGAPTPCVVPETTFKEDRVITRGLMRLSEKTLASVLENEPNIYTVEDLKVRFK
jgi:hypothetical protein